MEVDLTILKPLKYKLRLGWSMWAMRQDVLVSISLMTFGDLMNGIIFYVKWRLLQYLHYNNFLDLEVTHTIHGLITNSSLENYNSELAPCRYTCAPNEYYRTDGVKVTGYLEEFCRTFTIKENISCITGTHGVVFSSDDYVENEFVLTTKVHSQFSDAYSVIIRMDRYQQSWVTMTTHVTSSSYLDSETKMQVKFNNFFSIL